MVTINLAYTAPINPEGATPVLTEAQIWTGLKRKVKRAYEFVPVISACEVESEEGNVVVRNATFQADWNGKGAPEKKVHEVCVHMEPCRIDFKQEDGSNVTNLVSKGPDGELLMTYSFEWRGQPDAKAEELRGEFLKVWVDADARVIGGLLTRRLQVAKMAVDQSITTIRRLVTEGEIQ